MSSKLGPSFWIIAACAIMGLLLKIQWLFEAMIVLALLLVGWESLHHGKDEYESHGGHGHDHKETKAAAASQGGAGFMDVFIGNLMADKHRELNKPKDDKKDSKEAAH